LKEKIKKLLSIVLPLLIGVVLIIYSYNQFTDNQLNEIKNHFAKANYFYIFLSLFFSTMGVVSRAYRWKYSLNHLGYTTSFTNNFIAVSIGYFMNMALPRSGEISRALYVKKYNAVPFDKGFGTIVAERIVDSFILLLLILTTFFLQFDVVKKFVLDKIPLEKSVWILALLMGFFFLFILLYHYSKMKLILFLKNKVQGLKEGIFSILKMKTKWQFIFHTLFIWTTYVAMFYITIFALPETENLSFGAVLSSFIVGSIAIAVTSSGFGAYPILIAQILLFYNVNATAGTAFGWIVWISQMILVTVTGLLCFLIVPFVNKKE
jgi:glycosyltransferase 2 family protein